MKRKCNLELRLERPSSDFLRPTDHDSHHRDDVVDSDEREKEKEKEKENEKQQLTIFYNGEIVVCDATQLQARAIIWLASREAESCESGRSDPPSPFVGSPLYSPSNGLKRSLRRFLHTRKTRVQATSPCPITRD